MRTITRTITIRRPVAVVAAQFADVSHHERTGVHASTSFEVVDVMGDTVRYRQRSRIGPRNVVQMIELDRHRPTHLANRFSDGPFAGSTLTFDIEPVDDETSRVTATLLPARTPLTRLLGPVLAYAVGRDLGAALEEDRHDRESGGYPDR